MVNNKTDQCNPELELGNGAVLPERENIPDKYKWKLSDIYKDEVSWEDDFKLFKELISLILNTSNFIYKTIIVRNLFSKTAIYQYCRHT